jgi:TRAP-type C4-dicarboxylate transport system substrate-binding protein
MSLRIWAFLVLAVGLAFALPGNADKASAADGANAIRIATLAPRSSDLVRGFVRIDNGLKKVTKGQWGIKLYPSGVAGDEKDIIRKMRIGQMDGTVVTSVGLSQILRELAVLTAPLAIENYEQVERVQKVFSEEWAAKLNENGFKVAGWGEVGMIRYFSRAPLYKITDLKKMRPWVWPDSHTMKSMWHAVGVTGVPLQVPEVYGGLQTSMIDAFTSSALATIALQWFSKVTHVTQRTQGPLIGGMVFSNEKWQSIPDDVRAQLEEQIATHYKGDVRNIREDDKTAYNNLIKRGFVSVPFTAEGEKEYQEITKKARESLVGRVYSRELLDKVMSVARGGGA